jgi:hypothetical protein
LRAQLFKVAALSGQLLLQLGNPRAEFAVLKCGEAILYKFFIVFFFVFVELKLKITIHSPVLLVPIGASRRPLLVGRQRWRRVLRLLRRLGGQRRLGAAVEVGQQGAVWNLECVNFVFIFYRFFLIVLMHFFPIFIRF